MKSFCHRSDQIEILERLRRLRATDGPRWGHMHAGAMVRHLVESHQMALQQLQVHRPKISLLRGPHFRWLALRLPLEWGRSIPTLPELDIMQRGNYTIDFAAEHTRLLRLVAEFWACREKDLLPEHPLLGRFSRDEWMRWGYLHADHHLRQFDR